MIATSNILKQAKNSRSIKGAPIPHHLLNKLVKLEAENPNYQFFIGSASTLSRKLTFFKQNHKDFQFYDKKGDEFKFDENAPAICHNEPFMGINFGENTKEAYIYMYFPYDGALR